MAPLPRRALCVGAVFFRHHILHKDSSGLPLPAGFLLRG